MWTQDLLRDCVFTRVSGQVVAGTSATDTSPIIDMQDWDGVLYVASISGVLNTSVVTLAIQENSLNSASGMTTISATQASYTNSSGSTQTGLIASQVYRPLLRYNRAVLTPATANAAIDAIIAIQWRGRVNPANLLTNLLGYGYATGV